MGVIFALEKMKTIPWDEFGVVLIGHPQPVFRHSRTEKDE